VRSFSLPVDAHPTRSDALKSLRRDTVWVIRHESIGDAFFDRDAVRPNERHHSSITLFQGAFLQQVLAVQDLAGGAGGATGAAAGAQLPLSGLSAALPLGGSLGSAVGPRWAAVLLQQPGAQSPPSLPLASVHAEMGCEVSRIEALAAGPLRVQLSNGTAVDVATVVNATGVVPAVSWCVWRLCKTLS